MEKGKEAKFFYTLTKSKENSAAPSARKNLPQKEH
jgi:hypothetical protein